MKTEAQQMMSMCFWSNSHYWSSCPTEIKQNSSGVVIRIASFQKVHWIGFNFCKYHGEAVKIFKTLPDNEKLFCEIKLNRYTAFKVWCIDGKNFYKVIRELKNCTNIELDFIVIAPDQVPEMFQPLNLTFYERSGKQVAGRRS